MHKSVVDEYPEVWHYTTASGLQGILTSQQLWATDIFYLNDAEEFSGFFDRKLLQILEGAVSDGIGSVGKTAEGIKNINAAGGPEVVLRNLPGQLRDILRETTLKLEPYVASFCIPPEEDGEDGLLSQWRGYGPDGGFAIVFDTSALNKMLLEEWQRYFYTFGHMGNVDYFVDDPKEVKHAETLKWENDIRDIVASMITERNLHLAERLFEPILCLATRHKHRGFREESEVRISAVTSMIGISQDEARAPGDQRPMKPVHFTLRGGILVPYIALFERPAGEKAKLPIKKIVVGPHPEKTKRQKAIEKMLGQLDIAAKVVTSDIPFLGR